MYYLAMHINRYIVSLQDISITERFNEHFDAGGDAYYIYNQLLPPVEHLRRTISTLQKYSHWMRFATKEDVVCFKMGLPHFFNNDVQIGIFKIFNITPDNDKKIIKLKEMIKQIQNTLVATNRSLGWLIKIRHTFKDNNFHLKIMTNSIKTMPDLLQNRDTEQLEFLLHKLHRSDDFDFEEMIKYYNDLYEKSSKLYETLIQDAEHLLTEITLSE